MPYDAGVDYPFWMVWCEGGGVPTMKHDNETKAKEEAERLASVAPGKNFFVLEAKLRVTTLKPVEVVKLEYPF